MKDNATIIDEGDAGVANNICDATVVKVGDAVEDWESAEPENGEADSDAGDEEVFGVVDVGGYEADERELPESVYDEPIDVNDNLLEVDEGTYHLILNSRLLEDLICDPEEVLVYDKGVGRNEPLAKNIMNELFEYVEEYKELSEMNNKLVADCASESWRRLQFISFHK